MSSIDYEVYAKELENWYDNNDFYEMRTATELCNIFDFCNFSTRQFVSAFTIISKKFNSSEVISISQHAKIGKFENEEVAFNVLEFLSKLIHNSAINDAVSYIKNQKAHNGKNI